jgi:hypothetical protein
VRSARSKATIETDGKGGVRLVKSEHISRAELLEEDTAIVRVAFAFPFSDRDFVAVVPSASSPDGSAVYVPTCVPAGTGAVDVRLFPLGQGASPLPVNLAETAVRFRVDVSGEIADRAPAFVN